MRIVSKNFKLVLLLVIVGMSYSFNTSQEAIIRPQELYPTINGIDCNACEIKLSKAVIKDLILSTNQNIPITSFRIKFPLKPTQTITGNTLNEKAKQNLLQSKVGQEIAIFDIKTEQVNLKSSISIHLISQESLANSKTEEKKSKSSISKSITVNETENKNNADPLPPTIEEEEPVVPKISEEQEPFIYPITGNEHNSKMDTKTERQSPLNYVKEMSKKGAQFLYNNKKITPEKAIKIVSENPKLNLSSQTNNGTSVVYLSQKGMTILNGKLVKHEN